jgi:zinc D-Ala-D-Ala dipeptidase
MHYINLKFIFRFISKYIKYHLKFIFLFISVIFLCLACSQRIRIENKQVVTANVTPTEAPTLITKTLKSNNSPVLNQEFYPSQLVDIESINREIILDIRYATNNNFLKQKVYSEPRCVLRYGTAKKLTQVQENLKRKKLGLKVYDCYRPLSVQKQMWKVVPNENYVANPAQGSRHNRGAAVDLTLVDSQGKELEMPTEFDEFSPKAQRNYNGGTVRYAFGVKLRLSRQNRQLLEDGMKQQGFTGLATEWWHFDASGWEIYPVTDVPFEKIPKV